MKKYKQLRILDFDSVRSRESFPCSEELTDIYIDMLSCESVHSVHADIYYMIEVKDEYKSSVSKEEFHEIFESLPHEFQSQYHLKRDRVPFFNSNTMHAECNHLERKRNELAEIDSRLTIEHSIYLTAINKLDKERVAIYDHFALSKSHNLRYRLQQDDKECFPHSFDSDSAFAEIKNPKFLRKMCNLYFTFNKDTETRECA